MVRTKKLILIIKHIEIEGPGLVADFLKEKALPYRVVELSKNEPLPEITNCRGIISLGGPMNVYQGGKYPFLREEEDFLKKALKRKIPILGICLGAQLLAKVLGARVSKARKKELGWHMVRLTSEGIEDTLFRGLAKDLLVFQWHEDMFTVPEGGRLLAFSDVCPQAFRYKQNVYGLQFHFEVTPQMVELWFNYYKKEEGELSDHFVRETISKDTYKRKTDSQIQGQMLLGNFLRIIETKEQGV